MFDYYRESALIRRNSVIQLTACAHSDTHYYESFVMCTNEYIYLHLYSCTVCKLYVINTMTATDNKQKIFRIVSREMLDSNITAIIYIVIVGRTYSLVAVMCHNYLLIMFPLLPQDLLTMAMVHLRTG